MGTATTAAGGGVGFTEAPGGGGCTAGGPGEAGSGETGSCAQADAPVSNKMQSKNPLRLMTKSEKMKRSVRNANYIPAFRLERHEILETRDGKIRRPAFNLSKSEFRCCRGLRGF
jgi:hypothetical protein